MRNRYNYLYSLCLSGEPEEEIIPASSLAVGELAVIRITDPAAVCYYNTTSSEGDIVVMTSDGNRKRLISLTNPKKSWTDFSGGFTVKRLAPRTKDRLACEVNLRVSRDFIPKSLLCESCGAGFYCFNTLALCEKCT